MNRSLSRIGGGDPPSASKVVYVSDEPFVTDALTVISPRALDELLELGWLVQKQQRRAVKNPAGVQVRVDLVTLVQAAPTRAVSRRAPDSMNELYDIEGEGHRSRALMPGGGVPATNNSHIGSGSDFAGLGLDISTSKLTENAFSLGVDCAKMGGTVADCPFRRGCKPHEEWMRGFAKAGGAADQAADLASGDEAYKIGQAAGRGPADAEVQCPYPQGSYLYTRWLAGFKEVGGVHEEVGADQAPMDHLDHDDHGMV
jgi:hypothetical protein